VATPLIIVAQLGARMNYAVPRVLFRANMLARLYTDLYATPVVGRLVRLLPGPFKPALARRLLARAADGIPSSLVTPFWRFGCQYTARLRMARSASELTATHLWAGRRFCELIGNGSFDKAAAVYAYNGAALELLERAKQRGLLAIVEQTIAPRQKEEELLAERFPGWEEPRHGDSRVADFQRREELEWEAADLIVCGSDFVCDGIKECMGPVHKCVVVPYGVDDTFSSRARKSHGGRLRVLTVGSIGVRKGAPYVLEAARATRQFADFRMIGPWLFPQPMRAELESVVELLGPVPRRELAEHYSWADVFLLPSICEGSATVTYEALRAGLPVICTRNTGSLVRNGVDGFIVPVGDVDAIVRLVEQLAGNRGFLSRLQANAALRQDLSVEAYGERLLKVLGEHLSGRPTPRVAQAAVDHSPPEEMSPV